MAPSSPTYRFGDLLALVRAGWIQQMASRLGALGYDDYRRSDAAAMRFLLARSPMSIGQLGEAMSVSRQAARKLANGLEHRGYTAAARDPHDQRRVNIRLTPRGESYAHAVIGVIEALNRELSTRVSSEQLRAADAVLRAALPDQASRDRSARLVPPPR